MAVKLLGGNFTYIWWYRLDPLDLGIKRCEVKDLAGGDSALNASILEDVFGGAQNAVADALNLNAGVALAACEVAGSPQEGVAMAQVCKILKHSPPRLWLCFHCRVCISYISEPLHKSCMMRHDLVFWPCRAVA